MSRRSRSNIAKRIKEGMYELHTENVAMLYDNPGILGIEGLDNDTIIYRVREPNLFGRSKEHIVDLIFLYKTHDYELLVLENKAGQHTIAKGFSQLHVARAYLERNWKAWLSSLSEVEFPESGDLYCTTVLVYYDFYDMKLKMDGKVCRSKLGRIEKTRTYS
ncbi:MAG: hypothetical protein HZB67_01395 [Candidatus Aenigmarchaeota archaeon]|nr:hypothetical protein [Candidatus Aenigmarchaeota archaeon]